MQTDGQTNIGCGIAEVVRTFQWTETRFHSSPDVVTWTGTVLPLWRCPDVTRCQRTPRRSLVHLWRQQWWQRWWIVVRCRLMMGWMRESLAVLFSALVLQPSFDWCDELCLAVLPRLSEHVFEVLSDFSLLGFSVNLPAGDCESFLCTELRMTLVKWNCIKYMGVCVCLCVLGATG